MKSLTITLLTLLMSMGAWSEEDMISLNDYLKQHEEFDMNNVFYVYARCSAVNNKVYVFFKDSEKFKDTLAEPSLRMYERFYVEAGNVLMEIKGKRAKEISENLKATITGMIDEYTTMSNKLFIKTGTYFTESMTEDTSICNQVFIDTFAKDT